MDTHSAKGLKHAVKFSMNFSQQYKIIMSIFLFFKHRDAAYVGEYSHSHRAGCAQCCGRLMLCAYSTLIYYYYNMICSQYVAV